MMLVVCLLFVFGFILGGYFILRIMHYPYKELLGKNSVSDYKFNLLNCFFEKEQGDEGLAVRLQKMNISSVMLYGMGEFTNRVYDALEKSQVKVLGTINETRSGYYNCVYYKIGDSIPEVDAILICELTKKAEIDNLRQVYSCYVLQLDEVILSKEVNSL